MMKPIHLEGLISKGESTEWRVGSASPMGDRDGCREGQESHHHLNFMGNMMGS